ncbi:MULTISPECIES: NMCC_0638 family (lipo)protein [Dyella]|uniref:Lipoprotein n=2 Tax=Dyella TaxID=231454 RepID=A0A4R0YTA3_9GAMM|nr:MULTISPECIES: hypothetical protein [Dyella]TBR36591.1 hypothetical protein EYV96_11705 [Dyella terrae]TCI08317.1 hypothetical protein EZM97_27165 [Dyella soli]
MRSLAVLFAAAMLLPAMPARAAPADGHTFFIQLFASTCMKHYTHLEGLKDAMAAEHAAELPAEKSGFFLGGQPGKAWVRSDSDGVGYVVSLRDDGICAVFAQKADTVMVEQQFNAIASTSPKPLVAEKLMDQNKMVETGPIHTISYGWSAGKSDNTQLTFTLTTAVSPDAPVQAMASLVRTQKDH